MFHVAGQDPCAGITHVEAHGNSHHADRCTLALPVLAQREALGSASVVRAAPPTEERHLASIAPPPTIADLGSSQHSRAPPA